MSPESQDDRDQKQKVPTVLENDAEIDDVELKELGYAPELKRIRGFAHIFNMTLTSQLAWSKCGGSKLIGSIRDPLWLLHVLLHRADRRWTSDVLLGSPVRRFVHLVCCLLRW